MSPSGSASSCGERCWTPSVRPCRTRWSRSGRPTPAAAIATPEPPGFTGFARASTVNGGRFEILTVKPGPVPAEGGRMQAPCLDVSVFARGMLSRSITRIYFPDEDAANAADPVLSAVDPDRRHTLIAVPEDGELRFDIHLQGEHETVFFAL
ncbi:MAG: protocatechuate 3,4-dioxygenase subunit alpha [Mycobacteriaceae bacterium]